MPFTCAICSVEILVGEAMLPDERMNVAHQTCVDRLIKNPAHPSISVPTVLLTPPPPAPPPPSGDVCIPPASNLCVECEKPCGPFCPYCGKRVHNGYGWNNETCSLIHERHCRGAREARDSTMYPDQPEKIVPSPRRNGRHVAIPFRKKRKVRR
jgi:hypothetical protein